MKIDLTHAAAGLALLLIAYHLGKKKAGERPANATTPQDPGSWWVYAGSWAF